MTGFGSAEGPVAGGRLRFEVRSVNHRHLSVQCKVPSDLAHLEADIRERLRLHMERGHATVSGRWVQPPAQAAQVAVDRERARAVVTALREVGRELGVSGDVDLATVARIPEVVRVVQEEVSLDAAQVLEVLDRAARACVAMREREGAALVSDLTDRTRALRELARRIAVRAPERLAAEKARLSRNVAELAGGIAVDPARLAQEVAFLADRLDITEELVRFESHCAAVEQSLANGTEAIGKRLGFLLQELGREVNTMGSKANDVAITEAVIVMKGELEKMREQVENLE